MTSTDATGTDDLGEDDLDHIIEGLQARQIRKPEEKDFKIVGPVQQGKRQLWFHYKERLPQPNKWMGELYHWSEELTWDAWVPFDPDMLSPMVRHNLATEFFADHCRKPLIPITFFLHGYSWINQNLKSVVRHEVQPPYQVRSK